MNLLRARTETTNGNLCLVITDGVNAGVTCWDPKDRNELYSASCHHDSVQDTIFELDKRIPRTYYLDSGETPTPETETP